MTNSKSDRIMNAAHSYARAYAAGSFTLGDPNISKDEFIARNERTRRAWDRVTNLLAEAIEESSRATTQDAVVAGWELLAYAEGRREGQGTDAAEGLRELVQAICA